jgi:hypothetical protein
MKLLPFTVLAFCGFLPQVLMAQNVEIVVGNKVEYGQRQPILAPGIGAPATPLATFATHQPTAGISNQGRMGASSAIETPQGVVSTMAPTELVYQNATIWSVPEMPAAAEAAQQQPQEEAMLVDLVPSSFVGAKSQEKKPGISLGEVASQYKAMVRAKNVRIFTNTD